MHPLHDIYPDIYFVTQDISSVYLLDGLKCMQFPWKEEARCELLIDHPLSDSFNTDFQTYGCL